MGQTMSFNDSLLPQLVLSVYRGKYLFCGRIYLLAQMSDYIPFPYIELKGDAMKLFDKIANPREIRRKLGLNQQEFWTQIGVTQSGGSRYESGRDMPKPVRELLRLVHMEQVDLTKVKREDFEIVEFLKQSHPDLYKNFKKEARAALKEAAH